MTSSVLPWDSATGDSVGKKQFYCRFLVIQGLLKYIYLVSCLHAICLLHRLLLLALPPFPCSPMVHPSKKASRPFSPKTAPGSNYCNFLNLLHQVFGLTVRRPARYPSAGLAGPKPAKSLPLSLRLIPT